MNLIPKDVLFTAEQTAGLNKLFATLTSEQTLWLSGYFAGRASLSGAGGTSLMLGSAPSSPAISATSASSVSAAVTVLYGTESGNSEQLAAKAQKELKKLGFKATIQDMANTSPQEMAKVENLLVIVSTWGAGDPPDRIGDFYKAMMDATAPQFSKTRFSVCGLGDTSYEHFCKMGVDFDQRLEALGGKRLTPRVDCDKDFEAPFAGWLAGVIKALQVSTESAVPAGGSVREVAPGSAVKVWDKTHPFQASLNERVLLNGTGSVKETLHLEFSLAGSGIQYLPGDALGVKPSNCPQVVDDFISSAGFDGDESVVRTDGSGGKLRTVLIEELNSTTLSKRFIESYATLAKSEKLDALLKSSLDVKEYIAGREISDLLADYPSHEMVPQQLVEVMRTLPSRLYSIVSSLRAHPEEVHLTVGVIRYETHGKSRKGVASTYLADRIAIGEKAPVYIHENKNFRLPENPSTPILMVGTGTGIAPFRAFIEERTATNAPGKNWLFFGDQHYTYDFLYQLEWQEFLKDGVLTRLDVAFSRDAPQKCYVQHKIRENAKEFWRWLESGAHLYVCGNASHMAKDVHQTLLDILGTEGKMDEESAKKYVSQMVKDKRYQKDVY